MEAASSKRVQPESIDVPLEMEAPRSRRARSVTLR